VVADHPDQPPPVGQSRQPQGVVAVEAILRRAVMEAVAEEDQQIRQGGRHLPLQPGQGLAGVVGRITDCP